MESKEGRPHEPSGLPVIVRQLKIAATIAKYVCAYCMPIAAGQGKH